MWSGPYVGVHDGFGRGNSDWVFSDGSTTSPKLDLGALFGGHAGYQRQWGSFIAGIDISYSGVPNVDGNASCPNAAFVCSTAIDNLLLVNGRLGYALGRLMLYATGGWARSTIEITTSNGVAALDASDDRHVSGWDVGGGYEYMIAPSVSLGLEYIHVDYNDQTFGLTSGGTFVDSVNVDPNLDVVRARVTVWLDGERD